MCVYLKVVKEVVGMHHEIVMNKIYNSIVACNKFYLYRKLCMCIWVCVFLHCICVGIARSCNIATSCDVAVKQLHTFALWANVFLIFLQQPVFLSKASSLSKQNQRKPFCKSDDVTTNNRMNLNEH